MALTAKPLSTISYNTLPHLHKVLEDLFQAKKITDYRYIFHKGEDGDKDHFHVWITPNRRLDTMELQEAFLEPDTAHPDLPPLGVLPFWVEKSKDSQYHWLLYVVHDPDYLAAHNADSEDGKIQYQIDEVVAKYPDGLRRDYRVALHKFTLPEQVSIARKLTKGEQPIDLVMAGASPYIVNAVNRAMMTSSHFTKESVDMDTGEIIEEEAAPAKNRAGTLRDEFIPDDKIDF